MGSATATDVSPVRSTTAIYRVARRPSATFLVLGRVDGDEPGPGSYGGEVRIGTGIAPCAITILDGEQGSATWCSLRGPLPPVAIGEEAVVRLALPGASTRR